ncbi:cell division protein ZipA [Alteromonas halophila]|uniref:Cell division protein ZipA n=1 Tax=Alteromonas halophila TaxID=516698 RepID=A0A918MYW7_9ALTE|nr:cell division protein ZipA [Alteromonas halophila]GGW87808.1 cell division protein ZipA [Alteromonas halophila]
MEDELRLSLLIAGSCFIIAVLAHGIWKIRKNNQPSPRREEPHAWSEDTEESSEDTSDDAGWQTSPYDDLGLGEVRVVKQPEARQTSAAYSPEEGDETTETHDAPSPGTLDDDNDAQTPVRNEDDSQTTHHESTVPCEDKLYGSVVTNPKPHMQSQKSAASQEEPLDFPEPPGFLIKEEAADKDSESRTPSAEDAEVDSFSLDAQPAEPSADTQAKNEGGLGEQAKKLVTRKRSKHAPQKRRQEPNFGDDQMRIDFEEQSEATETDHAETPKSAPQTDMPPAEQEVLILNVKAKGDAPVSGAALLPLLLTLGFKFGDQDIFHRHVNSNGKGPVLFSLANMFKPGNFDIDNLENFTTQGVSLFMILPIDGDPHQVFNMMHNAARKIADEFGAQILDGRRSVLTKQGLQQYTEKIREFERQRMIARH